MNDLKDYQAKLQAQAEQHPPYADEESIAKEHTRDCQKVELDKQFEVTISADDPIISQDKTLGTLANFQVRCIESDSFPEYLTIDSISDRQGGSIGKVYFFAPRIVAFDETLKKLTDRPTYSDVKLGIVWKYGDFVMRWKVHSGNAKKIIFVIEADNRFAGLPIHASHSSAISQTYLYPTGKAVITVSAVK